jgi:hypothetical protein
VVTLCTATMLTENLTLSDSSGSLPCHCQAGHACGTKLSAPLPPGTPAGLCLLTIVKFSFLLLGQLAPCVLHGQSDMKSEEEKDDVLRSSGLSWLPFPYTTSHDNHIFRTRRCGCEKRWQYGSASIVVGLQSLTCLRQQACMPCKVSSGIDAWSGFKRQVVSAVAVLTAMQ